MTTRRRFACASLVLALAVAGACGDDDAGSDTDGGGTSQELSSYVSVASLAEDLNAAGLACTLEYEGLDDGTREVSLCTLEGELAELSVWVDEGAAASTGEQADTDADPLVEGANWTIDVQTADTAASVAEALGGAVRGG